MIGSNNLDPIINILKLFIDNLVFVIKYFFSCLENDDCNIYPTHKSPPCD